LPLLCTSGGIIKYAAEIFKSLSKFLGLGIRLEKGFV